MTEPEKDYSVVILVMRGTEHVLAITRNFDIKNPALPGGNAEPGDETPAASAARELREETGIQALALTFLEQWIGERGQPVYAFYAPKWRGHLRTSSAGKPYWTKPTNLLAKTAQFGDIALKLLDQLGRVRNEATADRS